MNHAASACTCVCEESKNPGGGGEHLFSINASLYVPYCNCHSVPGVFNENIMYLISFPWFFLLAACPLKGLSFDLAFNLDDFLSTV